MAETIERSEPGEQRVLVVEDDEGLRSLIAHQLTRSGFTVHPATTGRDAIHYATSDPTALLLIDHRLPDMTALDIIEALSADGTTPRFVVMTGQGDAQLAVNMMKRGAVDYLIKDTDLIDRLPEVLSRVFVQIDTDRKLRMAQDALRCSESELRDKNEMITALLENLTTGVFMADARTGEPLVANTAAAVMLGRGVLPEATRETLGTVYDARQRDTGLPYPVDRMPIVRAMSGESSRVDDMIIHRPDGTAIQLEVSGAPIRNAQGDIWAGLASFSDITDRIRMEDQLRQTAAEWSATFDASRDAIWILDPDQRIRRTNWTATQMFNRPADTMIGEPCYRIVHGTDCAVSDCPISRMRKSLQRESMELKVADRWLEITVDPILNEDKSLRGIVHVIRDTTARKAAETEKARLQEQLIQSHKMESVGRLAGGVAHDFNNMLSVILGYAEISMKQLSTEDPLYRRIQEIYHAAERSADLTRQLLAFARRQTIAPQVLDINETIEGLLKMVRRLIGEDIELSWLPGTNLQAVRMDPSQIGQILINLCVNARDAIADTGRITIETSSAIIDDTYCETHAGSVPGEYVCLTVTDDGCGMDQQTRNNLFEPFFTTKEIGRGTGLGLATVYGIVKQNNGFIDVDSAPGTGSRFTVYLPPFCNDADHQMACDSEPPPNILPRTILLVEDEPTILRMAHILLERMGHNVVSAPSPVDAISLLTSHTGKFDLLITDVVMPGMNGRELARTLQAQYPGIKCLFMSGYTADVMANHGIPDTGVHFIQKPFSIKALQRAVRNALQDP